MPSSHYKSSPRALRCKKKKSKTKEQQQQQKQQENQREKKHKKKKEISYHIWRLNTRAFKNYLNLLGIYFECEDMCEGVRYTHFKSTWWPWKRS